ncbi:hypothetical protein ACSSZE_17245 [Acidithiobacillus caldus]
MSTFYIVPALTDQAGQCHVVAHDQTIRAAAQHYRAHPGEWRDVGIMSSQGRLVCLDASPATAAALRESEPLMAGLVFYDDR